MLHRHWVISLLLFCFIPVYLFYGLLTFKPRQKFAPVGSRTCYLLAVDVAVAASGGTKLLKLRVERLPVGQDAAVADEAFLGVNFGYILRQT